MAAPERYLFRIMTNYVLEHFDPLFDRAEYRKANSKHHRSITKRCTGVAAAGVSFCFRASAGRNPVNGVVRNWQFDLDQFPRLNAHRQKPGCLLRRSHRARSFRQSPSEIAVRLPSQLIERDGGHPLADAEPATVPLHFSYIASLRRHVSHNCSSIRRPIPLPPVPKRGSRPFPQPAPCIPFLRRRPTQGQ